MQQANITFTESINGALHFAYDGRNYLYAGRKDGYVYGVLTNGRWKELEEDAANREYELVGQKAVEIGLDFVTINIGHVKIDTMASVKDAVKQRDELDDLPISTISRTDCRSPDGITIGLIDGMIAMARVLRKANLGSVEVQEALKDFTADEDVKWLMENSVQDWSFGEEANLDWAPDPAIPSEVPATLKAPEWRVEYCQKTWPVGWDQEDSTIEFDKLDAMNQWLLDKIEWCKYEDNGFRCRVYQVRDGFPYSMGKGEWESPQFATVGLRWKPTIEFLSDMEWMK